MSFMNEIVQDSMPIWEACIRTPFIQELTSGTLPMEKFKQYMIQDSIYLKNYARVYGKAIYCSTSLRDIQLYYNILNFVTDTESAVRIKYLEQFGLTDDDIEHIPLLPANESYVRFLLDTAAKNDVPQMLMAVLPCMLSYSYIFRAIMNCSAQSGTRYQDFIADYAEESYAHDCSLWCHFADEKCSLFNEREKKHLQSIFRKASLLELDFWEMAYGEIES